MSQKKLHPLLAPDYTREEYQLLMFTIANLYQKLDDPIDKFLVAFVHELGYRQNIAALCLGISSPAVTNRLAKIQETLRKQYVKNGKLKKA